ncbi:DeoR/GlpR family DNA-binding transcription regulator [Kluyvera sp. STS39-E]|uniref:DeoR/GlpR family DNA-binding transcription regulator n=1 Tax=Enterobacteriaceae TaxID=543 RepID=UPI000E3E3667|nr:MULTISPECIES: DeoR/GlpR family DNA-binding transcription regulator [Citrobacter]MBD0826586.1 DeoR/GlpR transcriptional regulator [Citrobacter sp. C1]RFU93311.1 DeoR/GlpR transcriptional regulator [Citrobacter gillenii]
MTQDERLIELEGVVNNQGKVTLEYICQTYGISYDSARRDLVKLTQLSGIIRIRGGAIRGEKKTEFPFVQRSLRTPEKERLAAFAASTVVDNDIMFIDAGTTSLSLARHIKNPSRAITNSPEVMNELINNPLVAVSVLGGTFSEFSHAILGSMTVEQIRRYQADKAFIGVSALSESGITTDSEDDALLKKAMADHARKVVCIATSEKFNTQLMYQSCTWADIDYVITSTAPPLNILRIIQEHEVELIVIE